MRIATLLISDLLALSAAYSIIDFLRSESAGFPALATFLLEVVPRGSLPRVQVLTAVIIGLALFGTYGRGPVRKNTRRLFAGSSLGLSLVFWNRIWSGVSLLGTIGFLLGLIAIGLTLAFTRGLIWNLVEWLRPTLPSTSRAVVLGSREKAREITESPSLRLQSRLHIVGFVSPGPAMQRGALGPLANLIRILDEHSIDTILIAEDVERNALLEVLELADQTGCSALTATPFFPIGGFVPFVESRGNTRWIEIRRPSLREPQLFVKRAFDVVVAALLLVILSPILALTALAIRLSSGSKVLFGQERVGYGGRTFTMWKFRTMVPRAPEMRTELANQSIYSDKRVFKLRDDPRVTPAGRLLRRASIDELPQLWNVIRGEMSLVGPRPPLPDEVDRYEERHYSRFDMKPGMTGPWQVSGRSEITSFDEIVALDTAYLTDWSIGKDFVLLMRTIPAIFSMRGAL